MNVISLKLEGGLKMKTANKLILIAAFLVCVIALTSSAMASIINTNMLSRYPAEVRTEIVRMIINGIPSEKIRFNKLEELSDLSDQRYALFSPQGGGATHKPASPEFMADGRPADFIFNMELGLPNIGTSAADLVAYLVGISYAVCIYVNQEMGIVAPVPQLRSDQSSLYMKRMIDDYQPPLKDNATLDLPRDEVRPFGCFKSYDDKTYVYYHVLVER